MQVQLWDLPRLTSLFLENHTDLPEAVADLVPMRQIWVLDEADDAESDPMRSPINNRTSPLLRPGRGNGTVLGP